jgi:hypothetical protein
MGHIRQALDKIRALFRPQVTPEIIYPPTTLKAEFGEAEASLIHDGVDYRQPMVLPGWLQREWQKAGTLQENFSSMAQTYTSQFGNPYRAPTDGPVSPTTEDPLKEWDWMTRERVLSSTHAAYQRNPLANSIVQFTRDFVVGDGFNLTCKNKAIHDALMEFIEDPDNAIREYEQQAIVDLQTDGEIILRFFEDAERIVAVPQRPWELRAIKTERGFFRRPISYEFFYYLTEGDDPTSQTMTEREIVDASSILFCAINRHAYELRGRPDLYRLLPWLQADKAFHEESARQHKWRNAVYWHVKVANATAEVLAAVKSIWRKPPPPGSAYISSDKQELMAVNNSASGGGEEYIGRAIRLMVILGARLPEYFFADGENANLASATKQELPALAKFEAFQHILVRQLWIPLFKRVIQKLVDAGELPEYVEVQDSNWEPVYKPAMDDETQQKEDPVLAIDAFEVAYEPVTSQNLLTMAQAYEVMLNNALVSERSAQEELGLDPSVEAKRMAAEQSRKMREIKMGQRPDPFNPLGLNAPPQTEEEEEETPEEARGARNEAAN